MGVFGFILIVAQIEGASLAYKVAGHYLKKPELCERVPLYTPLMERFATLYVFVGKSDTITVITGDKVYSRPLYEYGKGIPRFMLIKKLSYKTYKVIYTGYSTYFLYVDGKFWDTRYLKYQDAPYVRRLFSYGIVFKDYKRKWSYYQAKGFKLDEHNEISGVPAYLWSYGCSPTASAMILGYWDKRGYGRLIDYYFDHYDVVVRDTVRNMPNVQRELALYMETDTLSGYTDWAPISTGTQNCANLENGYSFVSTWVYDTIVYDTACSYDTAYMYLKQEVDSGRPVHWAVGNYLDPYGRLIEHSTCAFGYDVTGVDTFVILHNTWDYGTWAWPLYTSDSTYIAMYNVIPGGMLVGNINEVNVPASIVNGLYFPIYPVYDDNSAIEKVELYYTVDNASTWLLAEEIPGSTEIIEKMDFSGNQSVRFMIKTYGPDNSLISAESTPYPVKIIYPQYDGIFNARAFTTILSEPRTINLMGKMLYAGTTYGIATVLSQDSILFEDTVFGEAVFMSAQYDSFIVYGMYSAGFSLYKGMSKIYHDTTLSYVSDVSIDSERICVFERNSGFRMINYRAGYVQDTIRANGSYFMTGASLGNYIFVGTLRQGLLVYGVNEEEFVDTLGSGRVYDVEVSVDDSILYVLFSGYLKIYTLYDPFFPVILDSVPVTGATHIRAYKNRVFIIRGASGVDIYTFLANGYVKSKIWNIGTVMDICAKDSAFYIVNRDGLILYVDYYGSGIKNKGFKVKYRDAIIVRGEVFFIQGLKDNERYFVYDGAGRKVLSGTTNKGRVSLVGLPSGTYIVRFKNYSLRVLKMRE